MDLIPRSWGGTPTLPCSFILPNNFSLSLSGKQVPVLSNYRACCNCNTVVQCHSPSTNLILNTSSLANPLGSCLKCSAITSSLSAKSVE